MKKILSALRSIAVTLAALVTAVTPASAQSNYPNKSIRYVVPFAPGGGSDIVARRIALKLSEALGQQVIVDNKPGAATTIGTEFVVRSQPDGYTMLHGSSSLAITPSTHAPLKYAPLVDLAPVTQTAFQPYLVVVNAKSPFKNLTELLAHAKANPGKVSFATPGTGSGGHLATELLKMLAGVDMIHVPYKGDGPALTDLLGGQITFMFGTVSPTLPHINSGKLRALAVSTSKRLLLLPAVLTVEESGVPGYEAISWSGVLVPAGTPPAIINRLNLEIGKILRNPEIEKLFLQDGSEPVASTPAQFAELIRISTEKWSKVVKAANITNQ
jgi:tripartite-type tricarboxylate transporter receptor subunit TctC